jgi:hypothetical protein
MKSTFPFLFLAAMSFAMPVLAIEDVATDWLDPEGAVYNLCGDEQGIEALKSWDLEKDSPDAAFLDTLSAAKDKATKAINSKFQKNLKPEDISLIGFEWSKSVKVDGVPKIRWFQLFYLRDTRLGAERSLWKETFVHDGVLFGKEGHLIVFVLPNGRSLNPVLTEYDASKPGKWPTGAPDPSDPFIEK